MNRALDRKFIFERADEKLLFLDLLVAGHRHYEATIYHWVIMSNHFHLAVEVRKTEDLSGWLANATRQYSRRYHKARGGCGPLWQGRYQSILVEKDGYLGKLGRYIERNPVRVGMVEAAGDYDFSSAQAYLSDQADALTRPKDSMFYQSMGACSEDRIKTYQQYLRTPQQRAEDEALFRSRAAIIGDDAFVAGVRRSHGRLSVRSAGAPRSTERFIKTAE